MGSFVKLSNGKNAHVIAVNPRQLDRPAIQVLDVDGRADGEAVDLSKMPATELSVVRPIFGKTG